MKPVLKWAGGKTQLLPEILPRLPAKIATYYEPFVGGGAVFFALAEECRFAHAVLCDTNRDLVNFYRMLQQRPKNLIAAVEALKAHHSEKQFYEVREAFNAGGVQIDLTRAAQLLYLNKTCFNGLYRVNQNGHFNTPFGDYKNPNICDAESLFAASGRLQGVEILFLDFEMTCEHLSLKARAQDAVYFDPPYMPVSKTANFTAYSGAFGITQHRELARRFRQLAKKKGGPHVLLSNSDTPETRELYQGLLVETVQARRSINNKGAKRGAVGELLVSGKTP